jgi:hypothetical protein
MKAIRILTLFSVLAVQDQSLSQNLIPNGDFENDFAGWTAVEDASISTTTVHSGAKSFMASDSTKTRFAYVYQELALTYGTDEITFWVYPASTTYYHFLELIANWQPGPATVITRVTLRDSLIGFTAVDTTETIANVLTQNEWNKVTIRVDSTTLTQKFYINDILYSSLTSSTLPAFEHLLIGDLSGSGNYGTLFYDDISITGSGSSINHAPIANPNEFVYLTEYGGGFGDPVDVYVLENDSDPDGDPLTITSVTQGQYGSVALQYNYVTYDQTQPNPEGTDDFTYTVSDGMLDATAEVKVLYDQLYSCIFGSAFKILGPGKSGNTTQQDSVDLDLLRRFRDEVMQPTPDGARYVDYYYDSSTEIVRIMVLDRPDLAAKAVNMVALLQPSIRNVLDGDGSMAITQEQVDSIASFLADLSAAGSDFLQQLIADELDRVGPLNNYVGLPVKEVLSTILGDTIATAVSDNRQILPPNFALRQNFPNPFNPTTQISYTLPRAAEVELTIYNIRGQKVRTLISQSQTGGEKSIVWDGLDDRSATVTSGVYFLRLRAGKFHETKKMILMR